MHRVALAFPKTCCKQKKYFTRLPANRHREVLHPTMKGRGQKTDGHRLSHEIHCNTCSSRTTQWRCNKDWISTKLELLPILTWRVHDDNIQLCSIQKIGPFITRKFCSARNMLSLQRKWHKEHTRSYPLPKLAYDIPGVFMTYLEKQT